MLNYSRFGRPSAGASVLGIAVLAMAGWAPPQPAARDLAQVYLHDVMSLTADQVDAVNAGRAVAKIVVTPNPQDLMLVGAVRIAAPATTLVQQFRTVEAFEGRLGALQAGRFHTPAKLDDLKGLTLDPGDLTSLSHCQPAACDLQLPAVAIDRFHADVDWQAADAPERANRIFQLMVFDLFDAYRTGGNDALSAASDRAVPTRIATELRQLLAMRESPGDPPELMRRLTDFPKGTLRGAEDILFWSKTTFGLKPVVRLSHMTIYPATDARSRRDGLRFIVATKQLYTSRYFSTTLDWRSLVDDAAKPGKGFFLFYTSTSRLRPAADMLGAVVRSAAKNRSRTAMQQYLELTKRAIEKP